MRRFLLFVLVVLGLGTTAQATKVFADLTKVTGIGNGTWDTETSTFVWTQSTYASAVLNSLAGDFSGYTQLVLEVSELENSFRVDLKFGSDDWTLHVADVTKTGTCIIDLTKIAPEKLANVTGVRLNTNSSSGSAVVSRVYLVGSFALNFNDEGKAYIYPSDLVASGMTIDEETGVITKNGTEAASLSIELGDVDFSNVTNIAVSVDKDAEGYTDLFSNTVINNQTNSVNAWYNSKYGINYTDDNRAASAHIKNIVMNADAAKSGSMKLNYICITKDVVTALPARELTKADFKQWDGSGAEASPVGEQPNFESHIGEAMGGGSTVYGDGSVYFLNYVDMTGYEALKIKMAAGSQIRVLMNRLIDNGSAPDNLVEKFLDVDADGWATLDLTQYEFAHLNAVKVPYNGQTAIVEAIALSREGVDYWISGKGDLTADAAAALADETATFIDATGLTGKVTLESANPNCLFEVKDASMLANDANVLVMDEKGAYACENLSLQAGYAFHAPCAFTATAATISKTVKESGFSTFVSPFTVSVADGCEAYNLTGVGEDNTVDTEKVTEITANKPVMLKNSGEYAFTASNVEVDATPEELSNGVLTAVYTKGTTAPKDSYVLQTQTTGTAFYKVENDGTQKVTPFTAYLTVPVVEAGVNVNMLVINFDNATAVPVATATETGVVAVYDMQGRKVDAPVKGINLVKLSDGSVKKLIVK